MNRSLRLLLLLLAVALMLTGCEAIGAIFKAGFWSAMIVIAIIVAIIIFAISRMRR